MPKAVDLGVTSVVDIVERVFQIEGALSGDEYKFLCINPRHPDSNPSCSVNVTTGYWHCLVCGVGGDLAELGVQALRRDRDDVEELLRPASLEGLLDTVRLRLSNVRAYERVRPPDAPIARGPYEPGPLTYMRSRGFTQPTMDRWGVRFAPTERLINNKGKEFTIRASIAIPLRSESGETMAWCYRRTHSSDNWQPRYLYDREVSHLWFGVDRHAHEEEIVIVEGALDAMWMDQCGIPALGLLGAGMAGGQKRTLRNKITRLQRYKSLVLMGDRDQGGALWVKAVGNQLGNRMPIRVCMYSRWMDGTDPQELCGVDLEYMMARAVPWARYRMRAGRRIA